jgi:hypothetical protein
MHVNTLKTTARLTGLFYLGLAITGIAGFLLIRPTLYDPADGAATLANLVAKEGIARLGIALELGIVITQALVAVWFFKLFREAAGFSAAAVAAFGLMNTAILMVSAVALTTALAVALDPGLAPGGDAAATVQLMFALSAASWSTGAIFFGLWLIPMGHAVLVSGWMPRLLGYVLIVGGVGYVLSSFSGVLLPTAPDLVDAVLTIPATIGEFWIIGYLLIFGVGARAGQAATPA